MNELPREGRWSLLVAVCIGLFLAGLALGGVVGASVSSTSAPHGIGSMGKTNDEDGVGVYGVSTYLGQAGYFRGSVTVTRDLQVEGASIGYTAVLAINGSDKPLYRGSVVAFKDARIMPDGSTLIVIGPAQEGDRALGLVDRRFDDAQVAALASASPSASPTGSGPATVGRTASPEPTSNRDSAGRYLKVDSWVVDPGQMLLVATGGQFPTATVRAASPISPGTVLVVSPEPGMLWPEQGTPRAGSVVGIALESVTSGTAEIPILIQIR